MSITPENAEIIAITALQFLASDGERLSAFLATSGAGLDDLRARASDRAFLTGVLDHMLADESMLLVFCESSGIAPELPAKARFALDHGDELRTDM
ncbi:MAG: DUF3572 domain-containing protein [Hyphomicrobiales bacterium]